MGKPTKYISKIVSAILEHLEHGGSIKGACRCAGIGTSTFYDWLQIHAEFAEAVEIAQNKAIYKDETSWTKR